MNYDFQSAATKIQSQFRKYVDRKLYLSAHADFALASSEIQNDIIRYAAGYSYDIRLKRYDRILSQLFLCDLLFSFVQ